MPARTATNAVPPRFETPMLPADTRSSSRSPGRLGRAADRRAASPRQPVAFEAPRELLDFEARDRTLDEIRDFGVTDVRQLVYWRDFAPRPNAKRKPRGGFSAADSGGPTRPTPGARWTC